MKKVKDPQLFDTIRTFLQIYLPEIRVRSSNTIKSYRDSLNLFFRFMVIRKGIPLYQVTAEHFSPERILEFLNWLIDERDCSANTRNQRLSCMKTFYRYLAGNNIEMIENLAKVQQIAKIPVPNCSLDEMLSTDDIKLILRQPDASRKTGLRDQFYMALLYDTGCRDQEILDLRLCDVHINKDAGAIHTTGKGHKFRATPISKDIIRIYRKYIQIFHPDLDKNQYLFYTTRKGIKSKMSDDNMARFMKKYEASARKEKPSLPHLHPHLFRHARAMHLYQAGMPLSLVGEWLGHSQLETTLIYANADISMKQAALERVIHSENSVFSDEPFRYKDDDELIKKLYGLAD